MKGSVQRIHRMLSTYLSLGNRAQAAEGAVVVTNPEFPLLLQANLVHSVRLDDHQDLAQFVDHAVSLLRAAGSRRAHVIVDEDTRPEELGPLLKASAFQPHSWMGQVYLSAPQADVHARVEVRGIAEKSAWGKFSQLRREILAAEGHAGEELDQMAAVARRRSLSSNVRYYLALLDFEPVGHIGLLSVGRTGMLVDLAVRPDRRRNGLARAMIRKMLEQSRILGHDLFCVVHENRKDLNGLFQSMGFEPASTYTSYVSA